MTWTVVCKGKYFGPLSHFSDFCWALFLLESWLAACCPPCKYFLMLFLPGKEAVPWTRFESVSCRSCEGTPFEFLQACRARAPQGQLVSNERVDYSPAELACLTKLKSSYGYKQPLFHTVTDLWSVCAKYSEKDKHCRDYKVECGVTEREPKVKGKLKCSMTGPWQWWNWGAALAAAQSIVNHNSYQRVKP